MPLATTVSGVETAPGVWLIDAKNRGPAANTNLPFNAETSSRSASVEPFGNGEAVKVFAKTFAARTTACAKTATATIALDTEFVVALLALESSAAATQTMDDDDEESLDLLLLFNCGREYDDENAP